MNYYIKVVNLKKKHTKVIQKLKVLLLTPSILRKIDYEYNRQIVLIVDTSPIAIDWTMD